MRTFSIPVACYFLASFMVLTPLGNTKTDPFLYT